MTLRHHLLLTTFLLLLISCKNDPQVVYSDNKDDIKAYNLITVDEAHELLEKNPSDYILVQVSPKASYDKEHLPNAINLWRPDYGSDVKEPYGGLIPSREKLQALLQRIGYSNGKTILLYDTKANVDAMRMAWVLDIYGFKAVKLINGEIAYWKQKGYTVSDTGVTLPEPSDYLLPDQGFKDDYYATFEEVKAAVDDPNTLIIDTREDYEYLGQPFIKKDKIYPYKKGAFERGSITDAIHLNWSTLADLSGDHRIKAEKDLRYDLQQAGIDPDKNIILYCQSGSRTSHTFYVLRHVLGYQNVQNYDGSWIEWSYHYIQDSTLAVQQLCDDDCFDKRFNELRNAKK